MIPEKGKIKTELQNKICKIFWIRKFVGLPMIAYTSNLF